MPASILKTRAPRAASFARRGLVLAGTVMCAFTLSACLIGDGGSGSGGPRLNVRQGSVILLNTPPQGTEPGTLVVRSAEYACEDEFGEPVEGMAELQVYTDTSRYVITGGKLYTWFEGSCWAEVQTGSSSTLAGTWTTDPANATVKVPVAYREESCADEYAECEELGDCPDEDVEAAEALLQNATAVSRVTTDSITYTLNARVCLANFWGTLLPIFGGGMVTTGRAACTRVTLRDTVTNDTASVTSGMNGPLHTVTFAYADSTCTLEVSMAPPTASTDCSEVQPGETTSFLTCVIGSGFFTALNPTPDAIGTFEKRSLEMSREVREVVKRSHAPFRALR